MIAIAITRRNLYGALAHRIVHKFGHRTLEFSLKKMEARLGSFESTREGERRP